MECKDAVLRPYFLCPEGENASASQPTPYAIATSDTPQNGLSIAGRAQGRNADEMGIFCDFIANHLPRRGAQQGQRRKTI